MADEPKPYKYPVTKGGDVVEDHFGVSVPDPYRWLEDPDAEDVKAWIGEQVECTDGFLATCDTRSKLRARYDEVYSYEKVGAPFRRGDYVFFFRNDGLQNQNVLYKIKGGSFDFDAAEVFIDLNAEFPDGTTAMRGSSATVDGSLYAYALSEGGSDWSTIRVRDTESGDLLPDIVKWVKFSSIAWTHDKKGFFYSRYPAPAGVTSALHEEDGKESKTEEAAEGEGEEGASGGKSAGTETEKVENHMLFYHVMGTDQSADKLVAANPENPTWNISGSVTEDGKTLLVESYDGCNPTNKLFYVDLDDRFDAWMAGGGDSGATASGGALIDRPMCPTLVRLIDNFDAKYDYIANDGRKFWFVTNLDAPRNRIVSVTFPDSGSDAEKDPAALAAVKPVEELPEPANGDVLEWAACVAGDNVIVEYLHDVVAKVEVRKLGALGGDATEFPLPAPGTVYGPSGKRSQSKFFLKFTSFLHPGTVLCRDFESGEDSVWRQTTVAGFDPDEFESKQEFATSKDGTTKVPVFYVRAKSSSTGGSGGGGGGDSPAPAPCLLYGYGGFNISLPPSFSAIRLVWLKELGGVYAQANIRGGGEYGEAWHQAGSVLNKQNSFDDFMAVADFLIEKGITTAGQLGIQGGSNGGLLVLAVALQRPSLFGAVVSQVPVADMLRFHKWTIGHAWVSDFGSPEKEDEFKVLYGYSPVHNVKAPATSADAYPAMLVLTADHDDRVVPAHSFKVAAALQMTAGASKAQTNPLLIRIETKAGHGAGKPTSKILDEAADSYGFLAKTLGAEWR